MKNLRSIIIGIDFSQPSRNALREAARIAAWDNASLTAVHIVDADLIESLGHHMPGVHDEVLAESGGSLDRYVSEELGPKHPHNCETTIGHPFQNLMESIREFSADLLVLGSHGNANADVHRVGALAAKCIRKAPVNVLLVRDRQDKPFHKIVACVDFSDNAKRAARQAIHIARQDEALLEFVHIHQPVSGRLAGVPAYFTASIADVPLDYDTKTVEAQEQHLAKFARELTDEAGGDPFTARVELHHDIRSGIVDYLNQTGADLVVLGTRGKTRLKELLLGTTAEKIIHHATCSTLAIKPGGFEYTP